jgi:hypothetical protein
MTGAVVANDSAGALDVYRGNGTGTFTRVACLGTPSVWRMLTADRNGAGGQDIAVFGSGGAVKVYAGAAAGLHWPGAYPLSATGYGAALPEISMEIEDWTWRWYGTLAD